MNKPTSPTGEEYCSAGVYPKRRPAARTRGRCPVHRMVLAWALGVVYRAQLVLWPASSHVISTQRRNRQRIVRFCCSATLHLHTTLLAVDLTIRRATRARGVCTVFGPSLRHSPSHTLTSSPIAHTATRTYHTYNQLWTSDILRPRCVRCRDCSFNRYARFVLDSLPCLPTVARKLTRHSATGFMRAIVT